MKSLAQSRKGYIQQYKKQLLNSVEVKGWSTPHIKKKINRLNSMEGLDNITMLLMNCNDYEEFLNAIYF